MNEIQHNTFFLLNERNKIIFLLSILSELGEGKGFKGAGELIDQIIVLTTRYYEKLSSTIRKKKNFYELKYWEEFIPSPSFLNVEHFLLK